MDSVKVKVYAKINLSLNVGFKDGLYHDLDTVMTSVDLYDVVSVVKRMDKNINVSLNGKKVASSNAMKAALLLQNRYNTEGADIFVQSGIPSGGGLGGSSADAAAVIRATDVLYGLSLKESDMIDVGIKIGSDVPYMLFGGYARLRGKGEFFTRFEGPEGKVLVSGMGSVNTAECFKRFDLQNKQGFLSDNDAFLRELKRGSFNDCGKYFLNALSAAAETLNPHIGKIKEIMRESGLDACMTGSGAYVFGAGKEGDLTEAAEKLKEAGYPYNIIKTVKNGCITV